MAIPRFRNLQANDPFFAQEDHAVFTSSKVTSSRYDKERQQIRDKLLALHDVLYPEMKREGLALYPHWHPPNIVSTWYIGRIEQIWFMKLRYLRSSTEVQAVEEMMGVPKLLDYSETQYTKHPMMDIRIDSEYLAIELLVTDKAWLDAQNFKRKLEKHKAERQHFIRILQSLGHDYIFGGWPDTSKPEFIETAADLADEGRLLDWLSRFDPGYDWLRLGIWYTECEDFRLTTGRIVEEVLYRFRQLYPVYQFLLWTSDNDFR
ncbi:MAG: hypothetical protein JXR84_24445 [Anaerolineae bacterium]|nr:hypothetical protein [Anaerolineae bacterium]